ncbi:ubiquitin carboxyl-terminal hydrolase 8 [Pelomyxa schiedti]|nr:ubiquitin carboxyl-terminal hydrolase 8 [Pelomyxa schiedti]
MSWVGTWSTTSTSSASLSYGSTESDQADDARRKLEKEQTAELLDARLEGGAKVYLLSHKWFQDWKTYVQYSFGKRPPAVDNASLVLSDGTLRDPNPYKGVDYDIVPEPVWELLIKWYGGGPPVIRRIKKHGYGADVDLEDYKVSCRLLTTNKELRLQVSKERCTCHKLKKKIHKLYELTTELSQVRLFVEEKEISDDEFVSSFTSSYSTVLVDPDGSHPPPTNSSFSSGVYPSSSYTSSPPSYSSYGSSDSSYYHSSGSSREKGVIGLSNLGNTCYMNAGLQCLVHTTPLTEFLSGEEFQQILNTKAPKKNVVSALLHPKKVSYGSGDLARSYSELVKEMWSSTSYCATPSSLKDNLGQLSSQFSGYGQQDSHEMLLFLLDGLHEDFNRVKEKPYIETLTGAPGCDEVELARNSWRDHLARNNSFIVEMFQGQLKSTLQCNSCRHTSIAFDPFMTLSLPLDEATNNRGYDHFSEGLTIDSCIKAFLREEQLSDDDLWYCPKCRKHRPATKKFNLWNIPTILILHLKRFRTISTGGVRGWDWPSKITSFVDFPLSGFNIGAYVVGPSPIAGKSLLYDVYAVVNHSGGTDGGHYTACAKVGSKWYEFNDTSTTDIPESNVKSDRNYIIFLQKRPEPVPQPTPNTPASTPTTTTTDTATPSTKSSSHSHNTHSHSHTSHSHSSKKDKKKP